MKTITCGANRVEVTVVESIGGYLNETTDSDDTLYRDRDGNYYIETQRSFAIPKNARYEMPRDAEWFNRQRRTRTKVRRATPLAAMLWYVEWFVNDAKLKRQLKQQLTGGHSADIIRFPVEASRELRVAL